MPPHRRIDVHHHILPPAYVAAIGESTIGAPAPNGATPQWDVSMSLDAMNRNGISSSIVSVSAPGVLLADAAATARLARACNVFAAQMVSDHPARFGMFAALPLPDIKASLAEVRHADSLGSDGIVLMTNYRGTYLGDPEFTPIFDELNERKAVVYVHPTTCACNVLTQYPASMIEFPHDTTRAIVSLLFSGTFSRCPDIRFIFAHAGGTVPFLASRIAAMAAADRGLAGRSGDVMATLRRCYYDTAAAANRMSFGSLLELVSTKQVLLGTDFPFVAEAGMRATIAGLQQLGLSVEAVRSIEADNALTLFPRFAAIAAGV